MKINYSTLTVEQLEEYVEFVKFIEWFTMPSHLLTEEIKTKFSSIPMLNARIWLEDLLSKMVVKQDQEKFPDFLFFFIEDECFMNLDLSNNHLWCSHTKIWSVLKNKVKFNCFEDIQYVIRIIVKRSFNNIEEETTLPKFILMKEQGFRDIYVVPGLDYGSHIAPIEKYFINSKVTTIASGSLYFDFKDMENYFKGN